MAGKKRFAACFLILLLVSLLMCCSAFAEDRTGNTDGFNWSLPDGGSLVITGYTGSDTSVTIPSALQIDEGDPMPDPVAVSAVDWASMLSDPNIASVVLPDADFPLDATIITAVTFHTGDWTFRITDGSAVLTGFTGPDTQVTIPSILNTVTVTALGESLFYNNYNLTEAVIPSTVTAIGSSAFRGTSLAYIVLPNGLKRIDSYAFADTPISFIACASDIEDGSMSPEEAISSLPGFANHFPAGLESIGTFAFSGCNNLTSILLPTMRTMLGASAFDPAVQVTAPEFVGDTWTGGAEDELFDYEEDEWIYTVHGNECTIIGWKGHKTNLSVPLDLNNLHVTAFGKAVFKGKTVLQTVILPPDTRELGQELFSGCTSLRSADMGSCITKLPQQTFYGCRALQETNLPASLQEIGTYAFANCTTVTSISLPSGIRAILSRAFYNCSNLITAPIPDNLQSLGDGAFINCNSLLEVVLPDSLTALGSRVFDGCSALTDVTIGKGLKTIPSNTFAGLQSLKTLTVNGTTDSSEGYTYISSNAFSNCPALQTVSISAAVIGSNAFSGCTGLRTFSMNGGYFESRAFYGCSLLQTVSLGSQVTSLPSNAFSDLPALKTVTLQGTLTTIPYAAFQSCPALNSITLSYSLTEISSYAFAGCTGLTSINLPSSITEIGSYAFQNCTGLSTLEIPSNTAVIGNNAFQGCSTLENLLLRNGVESIGSSAFAGCAGVTQVTLPSSVRTVGANAFPKTTRVYCDPSSEAAVSISQNGGSFISPDSDEFGIRWLLDGEILLGLSVEQIWTDNDTIVIPEYIGSETVTEIGRGALASCPTVTDVTFPASVPVIPQGLCKGNTHLVSVTIPEGVTGIGQEAFANCSNLAHVTFPLSLTVIGDRAFNGCGLLAEVTLSDKLQEIGEGAFSNTKVYANLGSDTAKMLSRTGGGFVCPEYPDLRLKYLFVGGEATSLEVIEADETAVTITIPDQVTSIAAHAFENRIKITSVSIPDSVTRIGEYAFAGSGIQSITLPSGVTAIPEFAFYNTLSLTTFTAQGIVTEIGEYAFAGSHVLSVSFREGLLSVGNYAFQGAASLTEALLPDSVTTLGYYCFYDCSNLADFSIPAGVKSIPSCAFANTSMLETVQIPAGVETIENSAFQYSGLGTVTLPATLKRIESYAFRYCQGLKSVSMSGNMDYIGDNAFYNCTNLEAVTMPETLDTMGSYVFFDCDALREIELPRNLNTVPDYCFYYCDGLTHVKVGDGTVRIGTRAFSECNALKSVELPASLVRIGGSAFSNTGLTAVTIPAGVTTIDSYAFANCSGLASIILPDSVVSLGSYAFYNCRALDELTLSPGLTNIPNYAFNYTTSLTTVSIPEGIKSIGEYAFAQDYRLAAVLIPASVTSIDPTAFLNIEPADLTVYCCHDTAAESFAESKGHPIIYLDGDDHLQGLSIEPVDEDQEIYIGVGETLEHIDQLFTLWPENIPYDFVICYTTGNDNIAAVIYETSLLGVEPGDTVLIAYLQDNPEIRAEIPVHVRDNISSFRIRLNGDIWLHRDNTLTLEPELIDPANAVTGFTWQIDRFLGTIANDVLTPTAFGNGTLSARSWDGKTDSVPIHIYEDPTWVKLNNVPVGMDIGDEVTLQPQVKAGAVFEDDLALHFITFSSSDEGIAVVDQDGKITGTGYGTATITAVTENGVSGTADIYVTPEITSFNLQGRVLLPVGSTMDLHVTDIMPANANPNAFSWRTEPEGLVEYSNGKVTVLTDQDCEVKIYATPWKGCQEKCTELTIFRPVVEEVTIQDVNEWNLVPTYSTIQLDALVKATDLFHNQLVTWSVTDHYGYDSTIDQNGVLSTMWSTYLTVTATADNGVCGTLELQVTEPTTRFTLPDRITIQTGETLTVHPTNVSGGSQIFIVTAGTPSLLQVNGMKLTGLKPGTTELTVTSWNGVSRKTQVLIYDPIETIEIDRIESKNGRYSVSAPKTDLFVQMNYRAHSVATSDRDYQDDLVTWTSSDPGILQVTNANTGEFRTIKYGTATLTATAKNGTAGSIELNIRKEVETFTMGDFSAYVLSDHALSVSSVSPSDAYDGFVWNIPSNVGTVEGQILTVTADQPASGIPFSVTSWDGYVTRTGTLDLIREPVTAVRLDPYNDDNELGVGGDYELKAHVTAGIEYINKLVTWSLTDDGSGDGSSLGPVATLNDQGVIHILREGTVTVTVAAEDNSSISDSITLTGVQGIESFTVSPEEISVYIDETAEITVSDILPQNAQDRGFTYSVQPANAAVVENGTLRVTTKQETEGFLIVRSWNGLERQIPLRIKRPVISRVRLKDQSDVSVGTEVRFTAFTLADGIEFENRFVTFSSSDPDILSIDPDTGVATVHEQGQVYITATDSITGEYSDSFRVTSHIALESFELELYKNMEGMEDDIPGSGDYYYRLHSFSPQGAYTSFSCKLESTDDIASITYQESDYDYISWNSAKEGQFTLTVTNENGVSRSKTVSVSYPLSSFTAQTDPATGTARFLPLCVGGSGKLPLPKAMYRNAYYDEWDYSEREVQSSCLRLTFTVTDESIATVDEEGNVTALAKGETVVTVTHAASGKKAEVPIRVVGEVESFDLPSRFLVPVGTDTELSVLNLLPAEADMSDIIWSVSPAGIVEIDGNIIRPVVNADTEATITASSINGVTHTAQLVIYNPWVNKVELEETGDYLPVHENFQLVAHVWTEDTEYTNRLVTFSAYYDSELTDQCYDAIDSKTGVIHVTYPCTRWFAAIAQNGEKAVKKIRFMPEYTDFEITPAVLINADEEYRGEIRVVQYTDDVPEGYEHFNPDRNNEYLFYTIDRDDLLDFNGYYFYTQWNYDEHGEWRIMTGTATVTANSVSGLSRQCRVVVYRNSDIESVSVTGTPRYSAIYQSIPLQARISVFGEAFDANQRVTWTSDAPKVASVNTSGTVRTLGIGTATITATTANGKTASVTITVSREPENWSIPASYTAFCGQTITLGYNSVTPEDANMDLTWSVEPAEAARIEGSTLTVLANSDMTATLTATNWDGTTRTAVLKISKDGGLYIPASLKEIEEEAFAGTAAKCVYIPSGCLSIGPRAFADSHELLEAHIPASVTDIDSNAFENSENVTIFGTEGSTAATFASEAGLPFVAE